jgi:GT2 family glycosyltransferase
MRNVTAIIVSYKNEIMTCRYVNNELNKCQEVEHIIIVNNAATNESNEILHNNIIDSEISYDDYSYNGSKVVILSNNLNQGFAKGNNKGALYARKYWDPQYLLFTNDDIIINNDNVIKEMVDKLESLEEIGCIGPKILKRNGDRQGPENYMSLWKRYMMASLYSIMLSLSRKYMKKRRIQRDSVNIEGFYYVVIGCFFMVNTNTFFKAGAMDEHTFLYREEEILAERMKKIGKRNYWLPSISVTHLTGQTTLKNRAHSNNIINQNMRNSDKYYYHEYMNYPMWQIKLAQIIQEFIGNIFG